MRTRIRSRALTPCFLATLSLALLLAGSGDLAGAGEVTLTGGTRVSGTVLSSDAEGTTLLLPGGDVLHLSAADVARVSREGEPAPGEHIRFVEPTEETEGGLDIALTWWHLPAQRTRLALVGVVHIAEADYYTEVQRVLDRQGTVLYEGVKPEGDEGDDWATREREEENPLREIMEMFAKWFDLSFQLEGIDYRRRHFVHADMTTESFEEMSDTGGQDMESQIGPLMERFRTMGPMLEGLLAADDGARAAFKVFAARMLGQMASSGHLGVLDGMRELVLDRRNEVALARLDEVATDAPQTVAIFYGAAHMAGIEAGLRQRGYERLGGRWLRAWHLPQGRGPIAEMLERLPLPQLVADVGAPAEDEPPPPVPAEPPEPAEPSAEPDTPTPAEPQAPGEGPGEAPGLPTGPTAPAVAKRHPMLWEAQKEGSTVYLLGTIHVPDKDVLDLLPQVEAALEHTDVFFAELDMTPEAQMQMLPLVNRLSVGPAGYSLQQTLGAELYGRLRDTLHPMFKAQLPFLDDRLPWFVNLLLQQSELMKLGLQGEALDSVLYSKAQAMGKQVAGLETPEEQLSVFASLDLEGQKRLLRDGLDQIAGEAEEKRGMLRKLIDLYVAGNVEQVQAFIHESWDLEDPFYAALSKRLLDDRNHVMAKRLLASVAKDPSQVHMAAVGTAHMPGDTGLVVLLRKAGYEVKRIYADTKLAVQQEAEAPVGAGGR